MSVFDSHLPVPRSTMLTDTGHRKIELQDPKDLSYLIANVTRAAREKIDQHLPPDAAPEGEDDAMRKRVEQLVHEVHSPVPSLPKTPMLTHRPCES